MPERGAGRRLRAGVWPALALLATAPGCVSNPDIKKASTRMTQTLASLSTAEAALRTTYLAELDAVRAQVGRALVARAVRSRLDQLAGAAERDTNLVTLSNLVDQESTRAGRVVDLLMKRTPPADVEERADLQALGAELRKRQEAGADELERLGQKATAEAIRAQLRDDQPVWEALNAGQVAALLRLNQERAFVDSRQFFQQLDVHLAALRQVHEQVDAWIQTDATVSGDQVGGALKAVIR